jgi:predicted lysophospholipase L1 biosynthesis ABC-type transport system permease subunit
VPGDFEADFANTLRGWQQLADVVIIASLAIAGCSLAVAVVGGLTERKRPFSLLRLSGAPIQVLRRVVALETAAPMVTVAVTAIGTGFLAAQLFLKAQMGYTLSAPGPAFWAIVATGLAACLGIIASTLPLLERITGPETARSE